MVESVLFRYFVPCAVRFLSCMAFRILFLKSFASFVRRVVFFVLKQKSYATDKRRERLRKC